MQFKRRGWQYREPDGVVTMPGNARQAFPAKRGEEKGDNRTIRDVLLVYCIFAFTQFYSLLAARAILRNHDLSGILADELGCI